MKALIQALNGKKVPITLVGTIVLGSFGYGEVKSKVGHNSDDIKSMKPMTEQVIRIDERVKNITDDVDKLNNKVDKLDEKMDRVLEVIIK